MLDTRDGMPFLAMNGVQTQSARSYNLAADVGALRAVGIDVVRVSPAAQGTPAVLNTLRRTIDEALAPDAAQAAFAALSEDAQCNGFWHGRPGIERYTRQTGAVGA